MDKFQIWKDTVRMFLNAPWCRTDSMTDLGWAIAFECWTLPGVTTDMNEVDDE